MDKLTVRRYSDLTQAVRDHEAQVDRLAESARARIITAAPGQTMTYEAKYQEALRYPEHPPFPWLENEAEELGLTLDQVAQSVLEARSQWEAIGVRIERLRLGAKAAIRNAQTAAEMHRIVQEFKQVLGLGALTEEHASP